MARDALLTLPADERPGGPGPEAAVEHVLGALPGLPVHTDVPEDVGALHMAGHRLVTLTHGPADTTRAVMERAGPADCFETHLDVQGAGGRWKPAPAAYAHALHTLGVSAGTATPVPAPLGHPRRRARRPRHRLAAPYAGPGSVRTAVRRPAGDGG